MAGRNIRGIIFDVDGVLFDTEPLHARAWLDTAEFYGFPLGAEELASWTGKPCRDLSLYLSGKYAGSFDSSMLYDTKENFFTEAVLRENIFDPGLKDLLEKLSARFRIAWATSSPRKNIELMFGKAGIGGYFDYGVCLEDVAEVKPAPESYLKACSGLGLSPSECIAVEDSPAGVSSASAAGLMVLGIASGQYDSAVTGNVRRLFPSAVKAAEWVLEFETLKL